MQELIEGNDKLKVAPDDWVVLVKKHPSSILSLLEDFSAIESILRQSVAMHVRIVSYWHKDDSYWPKYHPIQSWHVDESFM
jgi:hypothetical protein